MNCEFKGYYKPKQSKVGCLHNFLFFIMTILSGNRAVLLQTNPLEMRACLYANAQHRALLDDVLLRFEEKKFNQDFLLHYAALFWMPPWLNRCVSHTTNECQGLKFPMQHESLCECSLTLKDFSSHWKYLWSAVLIWLSHFYEAPFVNTGLLLSGASQHFLVIGTFQIQHFIRDKRSLAVSRKENIRSSCKKNNI